MLLVRMRRGSTKRFKNPRKEHLIIFTGFLLLLVFTSSAIAQPQLGWVSFGGDRTSTGSTNSYMKDETTTGMLVNFDVSGMNVHEIEIDGVTYHRLSIPGNASGFEIGKPEVPVIGQVIEIPYGVDIDVDIFSTESITLEDYNIYPTQEPLILSDSQEAEFLINQTVYSADAYYPAGIAEVRAENIGIIRGHRLLFLKVYPVQFNPQSGDLRVFSNIEVRLTYNHPAQIERIDSRIQSDAFEQMLQASVLNYKNLDRFFEGYDPDGVFDIKWYSGNHMVSGDAAGFNARSNGEDGVISLDDHTAMNAELGCDYLIITTADFFDETDANTPVMRFREWKRRKGLVTEVVLLPDIPDDDINGDVDEFDIEAYIQNAYDTWSPPPTYVLLFGDTGDDLGNVILPTCYRTEHPYWPYSDAEIGTDLYYVTTDGEDYFPDIFIGRISVDDATQGNAVVDKIIDYEQNPPLNADYYTNTSLVCLFEDINSDGRERTSFLIIEFAEEIWEYLDDNGYAPNRIYDQSGNFANGPQQYENGSNIPGYLTIAGDFPWDGDDTDITDAIDDGNFIVTYCGHGGRNGWSQPNFNNNDVDALANAGLNPVVFSFACRTGWFDNETDDDILLAIHGVDTDDDEECFTEHLLRNGDRGAVAILGSTRACYTHTFFMMPGVYEAIWPDFNPQPFFNDPETGTAGQLPQVSSGPLLRMGQINTFSKVYMANVYDDDDYRKYQFELYHLLGDPEMPVWTGNPTILIVDHPDGVGSTGTQDFVVRVEDTGGNPVNSAVVCLMQDGEIESVRYTNALGVSRFTRSFSAGVLDITVSAVNFRPYLNTIEVSTGGAVINRLNPDNGTEGQLLSIGGKNFSGSENIEIYFDNNLEDIHSASGGEFGQSGVENYAIYVPNPHDHGLFNVIAEGATGRYAVDVFQVRDPNPVDLYTYSQWDNTTWGLHAGNDPTWDNPEIQLFDMADNPVASNNLIVGNQYRIVATIHNKSNFPAENVSVTFKSALYGSGQPVWYVIDTATLDVPANGSADAKIDWVPSPTGHLCIKILIDHIEDIYISNNSGQENCDVRPTSSPATVALNIWNPTEYPGATYFEIRQLYQNEAGSDEPLWETRVVHPDPQVLEPGSEGNAEIVVDPDWTYVEPGTEAEFAVTSFINGQMVGGVNLRVTRALRRWIASIHGGYAVPYGDYADYYDPGYGMFVDAGWNLRNNLSIVGLFGYTYFNGKDLPTTSIDDTYWININLNAQYRLRIRGPLSSYYRGGAGYYIPEHGTSKYGGNIGAGILYGINNFFSLATGLDYHYIKEGMDFQGINVADIGKNIYFALIHAGVIFNF